MSTPAPLWTIGLVFFCALLGAVGQFLFKLGSVSVSANILSWLANGKVLLGMALYGTSAVLFIVALKYGNLSVLYPLIATSYIWVALIATNFLGESFSLLNWLGIALIVGGVSLILK